MKRKEVAGFLALFMGMFGVHRFYLGRRFQGMLYLFLFAVTFFITANAWDHPPFVLIPIVLGFIDAVLFFAMPREEFDEKYNGKWLAKQYGIPPPPFIEDRQPQTRPAYQGSPGEERRYKQIGVRYYRMKDYNNAVESFLTALDIKYEDPVTHFNTACCFSMLGEFDDAFHHIEKAVEFGFDQIDKIHTHPALDNLRLQPGFQAFVQNSYKIPDKIPVSVSPPTLFDAPGQEEAPTADSPQPDLLDQLIRLGELREKGILTDEEFSSQKQKLLRN
ncbi:MAG: NINE protein [Lewinellaceae bacterium]|nr:NINE protein [Lewinellaceae bacterium]